MAAKAKYVYFFGGGKAEGDAGMKNLLGGKGANLAEMANLGIPVPAGFTITTEVCTYFYRHGRTYPKTLQKEVAASMAGVEKIMGARFGDPANPLLVSVRSGARSSMPGMMETVLNVGLTTKTIPGLIALTGNERFVWDAYRRLIMMYSDVVMEKAAGIEPEAERRPGIRALLEHLMSWLKAKRGYKSDTDLTADDLKQLTGMFRWVIQHVLGKPFPDDHVEQLWGGIGAVFQSWNGKRAVAYRRIERIPDNWGTAVNVQAMVFGNKGNTSATGVGFTRDPGTGRNIFYGEWLPNAQGEDVVAGIRTPLPVNEEGKTEQTKHLPSLQTAMPKVYRELNAIQKRLERHYRDMLDIEFTIEEGRLWMLQCRVGKRNGNAAIRMAVDMCKSKLISKAEAIMRVKPDQLIQVLLPMVDPEAEHGARRLAKGLPAGPGGAHGMVVFTADDAARRGKDLGEKVILVRNETSPEDVHGMHASQAILTAKGGMTSHAALVARGWGKCCIVGCSEVEIDMANRCMRVGKRAAAHKDRAEETHWLRDKAAEWMAALPEGEAGLLGEYLKAMAESPAHDEAETPSAAAQQADAADDRVVIKEGEWITLNGTAGIVYQGKLPLLPADPMGNAAYVQFMKWVDEFRTLGVRTNADTPKDAAKALEFGAEGIGLFRTEHMFYGEGSDKPLFLLRKMIASKNEAERRAALAELYPFMRDDIKETLRVMAGKPVTIRLLDPPLHEFVPHEPAMLQELADSLGIMLAELEKRADSLRESNPMMGHRGVRLGVTYPEVSECQIRAILEAAAELRNEKVKTFPEIMVPVTCTRAELDDQLVIARRVHEEVCAKFGLRSVPHLYGTMIEIPRAALTADKMAETAEFFSFGTNDLTQMSFGFSRDDMGGFLPDYLNKKLLPEDPFQTIDRDGVGELIALAIERGRKTRPDLKVGICGEHGGDAASVKFCYAVGMDYVSCSPFRLPIARLAAAQAAIEEAEKAAPATKGRKTTKRAKK